MLKSKNSYIATNRRASYDYKIGDKFEAGIVLKGSEVKSLRNSRIDISHAFISQENGEIFLKNSNIPQYLSSGILNHEVTRSRKLLLKKKEIKKISHNLKTNGLTVIPLDIHFNKKGFAKIEIAVAKGKKLYDKREDKKQKDWNLQKQRLLRNFK